MPQQPYNTWNPQNTTSSQTLPSSPQSPTHLYLLSRVPPPEAPRNQNCQHLYIFHSLSPAIRYLKSFEASLLRDNEKLSADEKVHTTWFGLVEDEDGSGDENGEGGYLGFHVRRRVYGAEVEMGRFSVEKVIKGDACSV